MFLGMEQIMHGWQMVAVVPNAITQGDSAVTVTDTGTDGNVEFKTDNTVRWNINNTVGVTLTNEANATYDIGSATNKVPDLYLDANCNHYILVVLI